MAPANRHTGHLANHGLGTLSTKITRHSMEDSNGYFCLGSTPTPRLGTMNKQVHPISRRIDELDLAAVNRRRFQSVPVNYDQNDAQDAALTVWHSLSN